MNSVAVRVAILGPDCTRQNGSLAEGTDVCHNAVMKPRLKSYTNDLTRFTGSVMKRCTTRPLTFRQRVASVQFLT
jgi:hypothetical protein